MLEITPSGEVHYIRRSMEKVFFGMLEPVRPSGMQRLNPTVEFWHAWNLDKEVLRGELGFRVRKSQGAWIVDLAAWKSQSLTGEQRGIYESL